MIYCLYHQFHTVQSLSYSFMVSAEPEVENGPYDPIKISAKYHDKIATGSSYDGKFQHTMLFMKIFHTCN